MIYSALIQVDGKIPSTNQLYGAASTFKSNKAWLFKYPAVDKFQKEIIEKFSKTEILDLGKKVEFKYMTVTCLYLIASDFESRDTTNMIKASEDALTKVLKKDDSKTLNFHSHKRHSPDGNEYILVVVEPH